LGDMKPSTMPADPNRRLPTSIGRLSGRLPLLLAIGVLVAIGLVSGCASDDHPIVWIENQTNVAVDVYLGPVGASDGGLIEAGLPPGLGVSYDRLGGCADLELIAKDPSGTVIARSASPVCRPSTWVIKLPASSSAPT